MSSNLVIVERRLWKFIFWEKKNSKTRHKGGNGAIFITVKRNKTRRYRLGMSKKAISGMHTLL